MTRCDLPLEAHIAPVSRVRTSNWRLMAFSAVSIRSSRELLQTSSTRSTCGQRQPSRRPSSVLPIPSPRRLWQCNALIAVGVGTICRVSPADGRPA